MSNKRIMKKEGTVYVHVYKDSVTGLPIFYLRADNEDMLPVVDVLEDTLKQY